VIGVDQVRDAVLHDRVGVAVVAPDASSNSLQKIVPLLRARGVPFVEGPAAAELGAAVGREATTVVGIVDPQLARGILKIVEAEAPEGPRSGRGRAP
jgi:ribosomal protein L7Ae-like RNA K-turn-binding protein